MPRRSSTFAAGVILAALCLFAFAALSGSAWADGGDLAEVRIAARVGDDGRVEFGLRTRNPDGSWSEPILPRVRRFPTSATVDRWLYSSAVTAPAGVESDLSVRVVDGSFVVRADGLNYEDVCGFVSLQRRSRIVSLATEAPPACNETGSPVAVLSVDDFRPAFDSADPQQHLVYDWEAHLDRIALPAHLQSDISLADARAVVRAVYADHFRGRERPPSVHLVRSGALGSASGQYSSPGHQIEITTDGLNPATVLHEVGHALVWSAGLRDVGHGPAFTAQVLALWRRYLPNFDATAALRAAADHDVAVASSPPAAATGGLIQLGAVRAALGVPDDSTLTVGAAPGLRGLAESESNIIVRIAARRLQSGRIEFALQPAKRNGEWGGRLYPSIRFLPPDPPGGRWLNSSPIVVAPGSAAASVRVRDDAFVFNVGGADLTDPCGNTVLARGSRAVFFVSLDQATCSTWGGWTPVLFVEDTTQERDSVGPQWQHFRDWVLHLQLNSSLPNLLDKRVTLDEANALADAIFTDHLGGRVSNPVTFTRDANRYHAEYRAHGWRSWWDDISSLEVRFVIYVVANALLDIGEGPAYIEQGEAYDSFFVAQLIALWERYFPEFDGEAARGVARLHGLRYADPTPVPATGSLFDRAVVRTLLGVR